MMIRRVLPYLKKEWIKSLETFLDTYEYFQDGIIEEVEEKIKKFTGRKYALCVNSASNAIFMCLYLTKYKGNEVIMPNYGYPSAFKACKLLELEPIPVDIKYKTLSMNPKEIEKKITKNTSTIVHIGNNGVVGSEIQDIQKICEKNKLFFLEDSAPSLLQEFNGIKAGCFGDFSIYSFSATKPLTSGEGAVIITDNKQFYEDLKILRHTPKYDNKEPSLNFCISPFLAAYLSPQISSDFIDESIKKREWVHETYKKCGLNIFEEDNITNRYGAVMYLSKDAEKISDKLNKCKIEHRYKHYTLYEEKGFPISEQVRNEIIDLPSNYYLTEKQISFICGIIRSVENYE